MADGLKPKQREFLVKHLARLYMTEKGRKGLERADRSPFTVVVGKGELERKELNPAKQGEYKIGGSEKVVAGNTVSGQFTVKKTGDTYLSASGPLGTETLAPIRVLVDKDNSSDSGKDPAKVLEHEIGGHVNALLDLAERPSPDNPDFKITGLDKDQDEKNAQRQEKDVGEIPDKASPEAIKAVEELLKPREKRQQ